MYHCILFYGNDTKQMSKYAGAFRIASELEKNGYNVQCIDVTAFNTPDRKEILKELLKKFVTPQTLWVGFSTTFLYRLFGLPATNTQYAYETLIKNKPDVDLEFRNFLDHIRSLCPTVKFITGGHRDFCLENYGFKVFIDHVDQEVVEFTNWCAGKKGRINLDFFSNMIKGKEFKEFSSSSIDYRHKYFIEPFDSLPIEVSRGCIFRCKFCSFPLNGKTKGDWVKNFDIFKNELLRNYEQFGVTNYMFADDTYNDSADKVKALYDQVFSKLPFKINFTAYMRLDLMMRFPETVGYLKESGIKSAMFGIETINPKSAKAIGKGMNPMEQMDFVRQIKNNEFKDVIVGSGFILGLPYDTMESCLELEEFLGSEKNPLDLWDPATLTLRSQNLDEKLNPRSEFDLEYQKYGYEVYPTGADEDTHFVKIKWRNTTMRTTYDACEVITQRILAKAHRLENWKYGGFGYAWVHSLGIPSDDIINMGRIELRKNYNVNKLLDEKRERYINFLREL